MRETTGERASNRLSSAINQTLCTMREENDYAVGTHDTALMCDELLAQLLVLNNPSVADK